VESKLNTYKKWLDFISRVEAYLIKKDFLKMRTPKLVPSGAMEASLHTFAVQNSSLCLPTSPEFALKKLWLSGLNPKIFEVASSFRAEEMGIHHLSEFTMLEYYCADSTFEGLIELSGSLLSYFLKQDVKNVRILNVPDVFKNFTGFELRPDSDEYFLKQVLDFHGLSYPKAATWSDLFHIVFLGKIEPLLSDGLLALKRYPPQLAALAKLDDVGWAERVEFYFKGVELSNGYNELLDARELVKRWTAENQVRVKEGRSPHPIDQELIDCHKKTTLTRGVGMAIGLERLFWLTLERPDEHIRVWPFGGS